MTGKRLASEVHRDEENSSIGISGIAYCSGSHSVVSCRLQQQSADVDGQHDGTAGGDHDGAPSEHPDVHIYRDDHSFDRLGRAAEVRAIHGGK